MHDAMVQKCLSLAPLERAHELERLFISSLLDVDAQVESVAEKPGIRQGGQEPAKGMWTVVCDDG